MILKARETCSDHTLPFQHKSRLMSTLSSITTCIVVMVHKHKQPLRGRGMPSLASNSIPSSPPFLRVTAGKGVWQPLSPQHATLELQQCVSSNGRVAGW